MRQLKGLILASAAIWMLCVIYATAAQTQTVWSGVYSDAQAFRGEKVADTTCIGCHGPRLDGGDSGPKLVGEAFLANWSSESVGELFSWIREAMPAEAPGTLSEDETAAVVAYILKLNKIPPGKLELSTKREVLDRITIVAEKPVERQ
ncbi:MAG: cytochrome c [Vicinamibacterales bacterium]